MPPARRKGGANNNNSDNISSISNNNSNTTKSVTELKLGDLVLAKVKGFPAWPAQVSRPEDWERTVDPKKYFVQFFGTREIAFVAPTDIQAFTSESKSKLLARCKGKTVKYFAQAVKEICVVFEELQKHGDVRGVIKHASNANGGEINGSHLESTNAMKSGDICLSNSVLGRDSIMRDSGDKQTAAMKDSIAKRHENIKLKKEQRFSPEKDQALFTALPLSSPSKDVITSDENKTASTCLERLESSRASSSSSYSDNLHVKRNSNHHTAGKKNTSMSVKASDHLQLSTGEDKKSAISNRSKDIKIGTKRKIEGVTKDANDAKSGGCFGNETLGKVSVGGHAKRLASELNKYEVNSQAKDSKNLLKRPKLLDGSKSTPHNLVTNAEEHVDGGHPRQKNGQAGSGQLSAKKAKLVDNIGDAKKKSALKNGKNDLEAEMVDEEAVPLVAKRNHHALDAGSNYGKQSLGVSLKNDVPKKRRAVRLCDDDDDDKPKTPVHGASRKSGVGMKSYVCISDSIKKNENYESFNCVQQKLKNVSQDGGGSEKDNLPSPKSVGDSSHSLKVDSSIKVNVSHSPGLEALDKQAVKESKTELTPTKSPQVVAAVKQPVDQKKPNRPVTKVTNSVSHSKIEDVFSKDPIFASGGSNSSQTQVSAQKGRQPFAGAKARIPPKAVVKLTEPAASLNNHKEQDSEFNGRLDDTRDKSGALVDSKASNTGNTLKNLIAQAKRQQAHRQSGPTVVGDSMTEPNANLLGRSPSPSSKSQAMQSGGVNVTQLDAQGIDSWGSLASPSVPIPRLGSEKSEERELSLGHQSAGGTLSGGTEAAVARDAFEGMIETLSRTKESIGRATRLAIDCAKYGIANEVVDLLIRKLENESSFHRRVDLFFLVDSITQCSHGHKGVAGASYLPTVQAALPRLLGAAAPPGPNARENRRQCLKVLRLWLERKILPESVLRRFMDDITNSEDDSCSAVSFKRPSKAERSLDDPIRGMEDMLVDEYGSNATFNLPGFLTAQGFVDDEEDDDGVPSICENQSEASLLQPCTSASMRPEDSGRFTPDDRRHHILEDVDGELEMEDATGHTKDGALSPCAFPKNDEREMQLDTEMEPSTNNIVDSPTLSGSPPPPLESPPPLPPLPSSPLPPPPPPLSPSPPPPPPPPSTLFSQPPPHSSLPSGPPTSNLQSLVPPQPVVTPQVVTYPPAAIPTVQGGHALQIAGNTSQQGSHFVSAGASTSRPLEYGQNDLYPRPIAGPSNQQFQQHQQFQPLQATYAQRAFTPVSLSQPSLGPFAYTKHQVQQHIPHPRSHLPAFSLPPSHPYSASNHHNTWVNGGMAQPCSTTTFTGEAYFQPPDKLGHHPSAPNSAMTGPSSAGHSMNQMLPSRPDMSSLNCWRPG